MSLAELEQQFEELALRHTAKHGFRTYDLLHVASALVLKRDTFWSFDPKASKLAALEGLKVRI
jgi:predicted nucleic acid-binding protein